MEIETDEQGGRIFFSNAGRSLEGEDEICILSVGVDIGSSTSHLVFSRIVLERLDSRYVVTERETFYQSDILLTPYSSEDAIDAEALGAFFEKQYENAMVDPDEIDAGALILTGVAVRRSNARRIGELFARQQAGRRECRRQSRNGDGGVRLRCSRAFDPRQWHGHERGCRRRHVEDRGLS
jgi:ethanolamine utilization protein EutA